jgi:hypothetical protein
MATGGDRLGLARVHGMHIRKARSDIIRLKIWVILQDGFWGFALGKLKISSTEMRISRIIGLPPKTSGRTVMRFSSFGSAMNDHLNAAVSLSIRLFIEHLMQYQALGRAGLCSSR